MAKWARIQDGRVVETTDVDPQGASIHLSFG